MGVGDDAGSIVNDGYQAGRLIKYSRLGLADSVRSRKDQWTAIHYKAAIGFVNISTTCITAVGQLRSSANYDRFGGVGSVGVSRRVLPIPLEF